MSSRARFHPSCGAPLIRVDVAACVRTDASRANGWRIYRWDFATRFALRDALASMAGSRRSLSFPSPIAFGAETAEPCKGTFKRFQFGHRIGEKILIICGGILPEQVPHQAARPAEARHTLFQ